MQEQATHPARPAPSADGPEPVAAPRPTLWRRLARVETVWVLMALFVPFAFPASNPIVGPDIFWTIKLGEVLVERGQWLTEDPFTFAPHVPTFVNAQWLAQVVYYLPYRALGLEGLAVFNALVVTASFGLLLYLAWQRCGNVRVAALCTMLATGVCATNLSPRPQTLGFLLFMFTAWLATCARPTRRHLVALAAIEVAWANTHGSFFLGPGLVALLLAGSGLAVARERGWRAFADAPRARFLAATLVAQATAMLATPYGPGSIEYVLRVGSHPIIRNFVTEWWPTTVSDPTGLAFFASVGLTLAAIAASGRQPRPADLLLLVAFAALGLQTVRNVAWWAFATTPILAHHLTLAVGRLDLAARLGGGASARQRPGLNALLAGLILLGMASALPWVKDRNPLLPADKRGMVDHKAPQAAAAFLLARSGQARMLNYQGWGGYLDWRLWPRYQPMLDGRIELHPPEVWLDYMYISSGHATWQERLERYAIDLLVLSQEHQPELIALARGSPRWQQVYEDELAIIFQARR